MPQTTTNADAVLKIYYIGPIREQLNQKAVLMFAADDDEPAPKTSEAKTWDWRGLSRESERIEYAGKKWIITAHKSRNEGTGAIDEAGPIPSAGQQGYEDLEDVLRHNLGAIELTRYAMRLSRRKPGTFINLLTAETEGLVKDLRKDVNRQAFGDQTGRLASVTADGANTVTVDTVQYLRVGMRVNFTDRTNNTPLITYGTYRTITAINASTKVVTYDGTDLTATTNHDVHRYLNWKREIHGLTNLISATGTIHSVDSTAAGNEYWRSIDFANGGAPWNEDLGQQTLDAIGSGGLAEAEILLTTRGIRRRYINTLKSEKRFTNEDSVVLRGGFKAVMFNEYPMTFDDDTPKGTMWYIKPEALAWFFLPDGDQPGNWDWVDDDGAILTRKADRTDSFEGYLAADHNLAVTQRNELGRNTGLEDDTAGVWN